MRLDSKFALGQRVFVVRPQTEEYEEICGFCGGAGKIMGQDNIPRRCPECYGRQSITRWRHVAHAVHGPMVVGRVRLEVTDSPGAPSEIGADNYKPQKGRKEEYMLAETGVGTGTVWSVEKIHATQEEAQKAVLAATTAGAAARHGHAVAGAEGESDELR